MTPEEFKSYRESGLRLVLAVTGGCELSLRKIGTDDRYSYALVKGDLIEIRAGEYHVGTLLGNRKIWNIGWDDLKLVAEHLEFYGMRAV